MDILPNTEGMNKKGKIEKLAKHLQPKIEALDYAIGELTESKIFMRILLAHFIVQYADGRYEDLDGNLWFVNRGGVLNYIPANKRLKQNPKWKRTLDKIVKEV